MVTWSTQYDRLSEAAFVIHCFLFQKSFSLALRFKLPYFASCCRVGLDSAAELEEKVVANGVIGVGR
jgi:hypothetical protein